MCRWLERDPAGYQDGPSLYSYLGRNPMAGTDPYGLWWWNDPKLRPPVPEAERLNPPRLGLRLVALHKGDRGLEMVEAHVAAQSAIATTNAERGVDNGLGLWDSLLLSDSPLHLTLQTIGLVPFVGEVADGLDALVYLAEGDPANASISALAMVPVIGAKATAARRAVKVADVVGEAGGATAATVKAARTTHKSWTSARDAYWKAFGPGGKAPKREVRVRFRDGTVDTITQTKELHHRIAKRDGGTHDFDNLMEVWPDEHALIDPHRHTGYEVLEVLSGP